MAPTKAVSKATSKTTKKMTPMSSQVKVHRPTKPHPKSMPVLPSDWPVASQPPQFSSEQSALTPGSLLQELCSGQDIHINKQALLAPSISKEKGRYLLILPGTFSLKPLTAKSSSLVSTSTTTTTTTTTTGGASVNPSNDEPLPILTPTQDSEDPARPLSPSQENPTQDESDDDHEPPEVKESTATAHTKPTLPQLGTLEGLTTPHPKLKIAFPALQKSLVFPGSKVHTSSKYMWLNCAARKKGTVACKGIFSSAIVFGTPHWESDVDGDKSSIVAEVTEQTTTSSLQAPETPIHYGGSDRTIDGTWKGSKKKKPATKLASSTTIPILTKHMMGDKQVSGHRVNDTSALHPSESKAPQQLTLDEDDDDDDSDDDEEYLHDTKVEVIKGRSTPKRQASSTKKKYTVDLLDSDVEDSSDDEGDKDNTSATKPSNPRSRSAQNGKRASKDASDDSVDDSNDIKAKKVTMRGRKANPSTKKSPRDVQPSKKKATARNTKVNTSIRIPSQRQQQDVSEESSSEKDILAISGEEDDDNEVVPSSQRRRLSVRRPRRGSNQQKPSYKEEETSDIEEKSEQESDEEAMPPAVPKRTTRRGRGKEDPIDLSEDSSLSVVQTTTDKMPARTSQRRSSAASKTYKDDPSDAESGSEEEAAADDDDNDEDSEAPPPPPKTTKKTIAKKKGPTTNRRSSVTTSAKTQNEPEESGTRGRAAKPNDRKVSARRQSTAPNTTTTSRPTKNNKTNSTAVSSQSKLPGNKRTRAKATEDDTSQHSNAENDADIINISEDESEVVPEKPPAKRGRRSVKMATEVKVGEDTATNTGTALSGKQDRRSVPIDSPSPSVISTVGSPFRSRRRKSTGNTKSTTQTPPTKRTVLDLSQDDDFKF